MVMLTARHPSAISAFSVAQLAAGHVKHVHSQVSVQFLVALLHAVLQDTASFPKEVHAHQLVNVTLAKLVMVQNVYMSLEVPAPQVHNAKLVSVRSLRQIQTLLSIVITQTETHAVQTLNAFQIIVP